MKLKLFALSLVFTLMAGVVFSPKAYSCGTVEGWVSAYFDSRYDSKLKALYFVHCEPIIYDFYKGSVKEHELLGKMILDAIEKGNSCERNLAIKNFFIFDNLFWIRDSETHHKISEFIENESGRSIESIMGSLSPYSFEEISYYCRKVDEEIHDLYNGRSDCYGRCKKIDLEWFKRQAEKIENFIKVIDNCLTSTTPKSSQVLKVKSNTLNLREAPTTQSSIVTKLQRGEFLRVIASKNDWYQIVDSKCNKGWVAGYLTSDARNKY